MRPLIIRVEIDGRPVKSETRLCDKADLGSCCRTPMLQTSMLAQ